MNYYLDITLLPNPETPLTFIWEKVYQQVHLGLVEIKDSNGDINVGVSFPYYKDENNEYSLGSVLRIISSDKESLEKLNISKWLSRLFDYVAISDINKVPEKIDSYACFRRIREKNNDERLARRNAKRNNITYEEALLLYKNRTVSINKLPFVKVKSLSSDQKYSLKIERLFKNEPESSSFDSYGLSSTTTVPIF